MGNGVRARNKEAIAKVLTEVAIPLGIGVGIKVAGK